MKWAFFYLFLFKPKPSLEYPSRVNIVEFLPALLVQPADSNIYSQLVSPFTLGLGLRSTRIPSSRN